MSPGKHTLRATREFFDPSSQAIDTRDQYFVNPVYLLPGASSAQALQWLQDHPEVQAKREEAGGLVDQQTRQRLNRKYPVLQRLPVNNSHYKIDYSIDDNEHISFIITLYAIINNPNQYDEYKAQLLSYKSEAVQFLKKNGIDTAKVTITYSPEIPNN